MVARAEVRVGSSVQARVAGRRSAGCFRRTAQAGRRSGCVPPTGPQRSVQTLLVPSRPCGQYVTLSVPSGVAAWAVVTSTAARKIGARNALTGDVVPTGCRSCLDGEIGRVVAGVR